MTLLLLTLAVGFADCSLGLLIQANTKIVKQGTVDLGQDSVNWGYGGEGFKD